MKQHASNYLPDRPSERMVIVAPSPHEGVARALRSAYRGGTDRLPPEMVELLGKLN
ncbi:hypothetical protein [Sphingomonas sanxanigenens]|uniref:hypothetical protein n=1 Tax=Sphingomonas sanxanigenens TaxID=397260 RepID=UPI0014706804|nr:hypothetical protein [Sphingomonas sanxanigenens]